MPSSDSRYSGCLQAAYGPTWTSVASLRPAMNSEVQKRPSAAMATSTNPTNPSQAARGPGKRGALGERDQDDAGDDGQRHQAHARCAAGVVHEAGLHAVMQAF